MIVACNNNIKEVQYSGFTIDAIYACGGQLVWEKDPSPTPTPCLNSQLPSDFVLNYNAKGYNASTHTMEKYSGQTNGINCVLSGDVENIVVYPDHLDLTQTNGVYANVTGNADFRRGNTNADNMTIIAKAYNPSYETNSFLLTNKDNWSFRWYNDNIMVGGAAAYRCLAVSNNTPNIVVTNTYGNNTQCTDDCSGIHFYNITTNEDCPNSGTTGFTEFRYGSTSNNIARLFTRDGSNSFWKGNFYWIFMAKRTLSWNEVQQVIDYNENCYGSTRIAQWNKAATTDYTCSGTTKMYKEYYQYSDDGGVTWHNVIPESSRTSSDVIEYDSVDCGYIPYLRLKFSSSGLVNFSGGEIYASKNGGNWYKPYHNEVVVSSGDVVQFKGSLTPGIGIGSFSATTGNFEVEGDPMALIYGDGITGETELSGETFNGLFRECSGLTNAEKLTLPIMRLTPSCYQSMFAYCTNLTKAPELPATSLAQSCYQNMFYGCTSLNYIKCLAKNVVLNSTYGWVNGVSSNGTFVKNPEKTDWSTATSSNHYQGIPSGWTVVDA